MADFVQIPPPGDGSPSGSVFVGDVFFFSSSWIRLTSAGVGVASVQCCDFGQIIWIVIFGVLQMFTKGIIVLLFDITFTHLSVLALMYPGLALWVGFYSF